MADTATATARDGRGRFQPGQSGNPAGRKPGTLNHATQLKRLLGDDAYDRVARTVIDAACDGHLPSVRFLMERLVAKPRGRAIALELPPGATRVERLTALVDQMCAGEISADEAKAMIAVIDELDRAEVADRSTRHRARRAEPAGAAEAPTRDPSPAGGGGRGGAADSDAPQCVAGMSLVAKPPGLRARLLQTTCISTPAGTVGRDPGALVATAAREAVQAAVAARAAWRAAA